MKVLGVLFDCDGVVLDTDNSYRALVSKLLTNEFNYPITLNECIERWKGKNADQIARELFFEGCDFTEEFITRIHKLSEDYQIDESIIVPNLIKLLDSIDLPKGICSNGRSVRIISNLKDVKLDNYFDFVFGRDNLGVMKPNPQVYIRGAEKLGVDIKNCIVVEDSPTGLQAGVEAGAITVAFTGTGTNKEDLANLKPNFIINDLSELIEIINNNKG